MLKGAWNVTGGIDIFGVGAMVATGDAIDNVMGSPGTVMARVMTAGTCDDRKAALEMTGAAKALNGDVSRANCAEVASTLAKGVASALVKGVASALVKGVASALV